MFNRDDYKNQKRETFGVKSLPPDDDPVDDRPLCLHVGIEAPAIYSSKPIVKAWEENGYQVEFMDWQLIKLNESVEGMWDRVMAKVMMVSPDIIFLHIQNKDAILDTWVQALQDTAPVVNYVFDVRDKEKSIWLYNLCKHVSLNCLASQEDVNECKAMGYNNAIVVQSSADYDFYKSKLKKTDLQKPVPEIIFIGMNHQNTNAGFPLAAERQEMCAFLKSQYGDMFESFGMNQENSHYIHHSEELHLYQNSKIVIGHNNFKREGYSSDRMFRAMGSGAFYLSSYFPGIENMFQREVHLDWWEDFGQLKSLIDFYLSEDAEREAIAEIGSNFVRENHRWADRIKLILNTLEQKQII